MPVTPSFLTSRLLTKSRRFARRGLATLWMVIWLPCLLVLFCVMVGMANLWLARVELENAMEATALAAVKEWGEHNGGDTLVPRQLGVAYAAANGIRGLPVVIGTNYDLASSPNQNQACDPGMSPPSGNLIFGAIQDDLPAFPGEVVFNAGLKPNCGAGNVMFDATGSGGGNLAPKNAWGIAFQVSPDTPPGLRIERIDIDLRANGASGSFVAPVNIADNNSPPQFAVHDMSNHKQADILGFKIANINNPATTQIEWSLASPGVLRFDFRADPTDANGDDGFGPGDRFRFGVDVQDVSSGNGHDDGDGIGRDGATMTVYFSLNGSPLPPITGRYNDNMERSNDCFNPALTSPITGTLVVHPANVPDLPCPPTSSANNNGQSFGQIAASGSLKFAVRAQAISPAAMFSFPPLGNVTGYCVQAKATAEYDCITKRVRLVRVDRFICPGP